MTDAGNSAGQSLCIALRTGDRQKVNCPKGKRDHPGVHQSADWFAMTVFFDKLKGLLRCNSPLMFTY